MLKTIGRLITVWLCLAACSPVTPIAPTPLPTLTPSGRPTLAPPATSRLSETPTLTPPSPSPTPTQAPREHPGPRAMADMVFHQGLGMVVMLNGSRDDHRVWGWDGTHWQIVGEGGPNVRSLGGVAYDPARDKVLVYGGYSLNSNRCQFDTWEWDGQGWQQFEVTSPEVCSHFVMEYNAALEKVVLFGGGDDQQNIHSGMWTWDGQAWDKLDIETPDVRFHAMSASDPVHHTLFLVGGFDVNYQIVDEFWAWDGTLWEPLTLPRPTALSHARMAFDSNRAQLVLFGGSTRARLPLDLKNDTWIFIGDAWQPVNGPAPSARGGQAMAYDPVRDRVVLYGGFDQADQELADTWEWDGEGWACVDRCEAGQATVSSPTSGSGMVLYRGDAQRTGAYAFPAIRELPSLQWQKNLNDVGPAPVLADEVLYVSAQNRQLCALNAETGEELWCASSGDLSSPVAVAGEAVFVNTVSGQALAFHRDTGAKLWSVAIKGSGWGAPLVIGEMVYIVSERGVYALEAHTGTVMWEKSTGSHRGFVGSPAWAEGVLYFEAGPTLYALDGATGQELWAVQRETWFYSLALANGLLYLGSDDGHFYAFDQKTGLEIWRTELAGAGWSAPSIAKGAVYVGNIDQHIYAYDALTGNTLWKTKVEDWATSDPVVSEGVVYVGSGNHEMREGPRHLYALDAQTGVELWKYKAEARLLTAPALGPDAIYIVSVSGAIYALK